MRVSEAAAVLKLPSSSNGLSLAEIRSCFRRQVIASHPDKGGTTEVFLQVMRAFHILSRHLQEQETFKHKRPRLSCRQRQPVVINRPQKQTGCVESRLDQTRFPDPAENVWDLALVSDAIVPLSSGASTCDDNSEVEFSLEFETQEKLCKGKQARSPCSGLTGIHKASDDTYMASFTCKKLNGSMRIRKTLEAAVQDHIVLSHIFVGYRAVCESRCDPQSAKCMEVLLQEVIAAAVQSCEAKLEDGDLLFRWIYSRRFDNVSISLHTPKTTSLHMLAEHWFRLVSPPSAQSWSEFRETYLDVKGNLALQRLDARYEKRKREVDQGRHIVPWEDRFEQLKHWLAVNNGTFPRDRARVPFELELASWVRHQRFQKRHRNMNKEHAAALESLPAWTWGEAKVKIAWESHYNKLRTWIVSNEGRYPKHTSDDLEERALAFWVKNQLAAHAGQGSRKSMLPEHTAQLASLPGWRWRQPCKKRDVDAMSRPEENK